jgi:pyrroloquinoline quinone (PQQ) biosynthesis protein C
MTAVRWYVYVDDDRLLPHTFRDYQSGPKIAQGTVPSWDVQAYMWQSQYDQELDAWIVRTPEGQIRHYYYSHSVDVATGQRVTP